MKYIEEEDLKVNSYYLVKTYDGEFAVIKYWGGGKDTPWGLDQTWGQIRYPLREVDLEIEQIYNNK